MNYRVVYLDRAKRVWLPGNWSLAQATQFVNQFKRRGQTAWVVDDRGDFVPIKGTRRQPGYIA